MSSSRRKRSLIKLKNQEKEIPLLNQPKDLASKGQRRNQSRLCVLCQKNSHKFQQNCLSQNLNLNHRLGKNTNTKRKRKKEREKDSDKGKGKEVILRRMRLLRMMNKNQRRKEKPMMMMTIC